VNICASAETAVQQTQHLHRRTDTSFVEKEPPFLKWTYLGENKNLVHVSRRD
jgi:hypothetical protein